MRITEYLVSWNEEKSTENCTYQDREDADSHVRRLLSMKKKSNHISNIKLKRRVVIYSKWKKVVKE